MLQVHRLARHGAHGLSRRVDGVGRIGRQNLTSLRSWRVQQLKGGALRMRWKSTNEKTVITAVDDVNAHYNVSSHEKNAVNENDPLLLEQLSSSHNKLLDTLSLIPQQVDEIELRAYEEDTYVTEATIAQQRSGMYYRQIKIEEEQMQDAVNSYTDRVSTMMELGRATSMKYIQKVLLQWYEPMSLMLTDEVKSINKAKVSQEGRDYGPTFLLLPVEKLTVLTLNCVLNAVLRSGNSGVQFNQLSMQVGHAVEMEVNIHKLKMGRGKLKSWEQELVDKSYTDRKFAHATGQRIRRLLGDEPWSNVLKVKVGARLIQIMLETAKHEDKSAFVHTNWYSVSRQRRLRLVHLEEPVFKLIAERELHMVLPRYLPMIVPPKAWNNRKANGAYFRLKAPLMRTYNRSQTDAIRRADMGGVLEGLDYLGKQPWRINERIFSVFREALDRGIKVGELPSTKNIDQPLQTDCYSLPSAMFDNMAVFKKRQKEREAKKKARTAKNASKTLKAAQEAANIDPAAMLTVGGDTIDGFSSDSLSQEIDDDDHDEEDEDGEDIEDELARMETEMMTDPDTPVFDERLYNEMCRRVKLKNAELHSLRCDAQLKYWVAEKFIEDVIYFPCNLDFRGRAYPIPPNLSHLGSDLCRGLLSFAEAKPLGDAGFFWLKVHLCNLFGNNKQSFEERAAWVDDNMPRLYDSVQNPLDGDRWWNTAEEPFQALAAMHEIINAIDSGNPTMYACNLPVHQDGSCNGLQHYAALGRDLAGGTAVNLTPNEEPQDVYSRVLDIVLVKMKHDEDMPEEVGVPYHTATGEFDPNGSGQKLTTEMDVKHGRLARLLSGYVVRKVIKQTVMTSVYGVTKIGARAQIQNRLEEKMYRGRIMTPELDRELFDASRYLADLTLNSLTEMFSGAKEIMDWLGNCAHLVAKAGHVMTWVSPMGLPVMQPYRQMASQTVKTTMQSITLSVEDEALPVSTNKQRSAFPPNYVHSLDATHMLMTCLKMKDQGLTFASVHDSYWTHAGDVPVLSKLIRECFVELYSGPVLEDTRESLVMRYPDIEFPPVPKGGELKLEDVIDSKYFFH